MKKVFSKHSVKEVREWGDLLMKNYHFLYSSEKPMNLAYVKPFANTSDLVNKTPNIHEKEKVKKDEAKQKLAEKGKEVVLEMEKELDNKESNAKAGENAGDEYGVKQEKKSKNEKDEEAEK